MERDPGMEEWNKIISLKEVENRYGGKDIKI